MGVVDSGSEKPTDSSSVAATAAESDLSAVKNVTDCEKKCDRSLLDEVNFPNSDFLHSKEKIEEGDTIIIYVNFGSTYAIKVRRGQTLTMRYGALRHEFLIGKPYGSRVSATAGYVYALRGSPELWTRTLPHRTQILYTYDNALIAMLLDLKPGSIVAESGTGSGSLSHSLARTIAPTGHLHTFDIEQQRVDSVREELMSHGLGEVVTLSLRNVCEVGFGLKNAVDGVFLDLPNPWLAVPFAVEALKKSETTRLVSFSPCIEQVQRTCDVMRKLGFVQVETVELVPRTYKVIDLPEESLEQFAAVGKEKSEQNAEGPTGAKRRKMADGSGADGGRRAIIPFPAQQPTHTGYLTSGTLLASR